MPKHQICTTHLVIATNEDRQATKLEENQLLHNYHDNPLPILQISSGISYNNQQSTTLKSLQDQFDRFHYQTNLFIQKNLHLDANQNKSTNNQSNKF